MAGHGWLTIPWLIRLDFFGYEFFFSKISMLEYSKFAQTFCFIVYTEEVIEIIHNAFKLGRSVAVIALYCKLARLVFALRII